MIESGRRVLQLYIIRRRKLRTRNKTARETGRDVLHFTEAQKGLTAKRMEQESRNMEWGISLPLYLKKIPKNKIDR